MARVLDVDNRQQCQNKKTKQMKKTTKKTPSSFKYKNINIRIVNDYVLYIELEGFVYYIDNSTNEQIFKKWKDNRIDQATMPK